MKTKSKALITLMIVFSLCFAFARTSIAASDPNPDASSKAVAIFYDACLKQYGSFSKNPIETMKITMPDYLADLRQEVIGREYKLVVYTINTADISAVKADVKKLVGATAYKSIVVKKAENQKYNRNTIYALTDVVRAELSKYNDNASSPLYGAGVVQSQYNAKRNGDNADIKKNGIELLGVQVQMPKLTDEKIAYFKKTILDHPAIFFGGN